MFTASKPVRVPTYLPANPLLLLREVKHYYIDISDLFSAECGDYVVEDYPDHTYLSTYKFVPHQDSELEIRIMDNHKKHV